MNDEEKSAVRIEPEALEEEFVRVPADLARANELYADVSALALEAKQRVDRKYAELLLKFKDAHDPEDGKRPTESVIKAKIETHVAYIEAQSKLVRATREKLRAYGIVDALRAKKDSLISIAAHRRAEMGGGLNVKRNAQGEDEDEEDDDLS